MDYNDVVDCLLQYNNLFNCSIYLTKSNLINIFNYSFKKMVYFLKSHLSFRYRWQFFNYFLVINKNIRQIMNNSILVPF